MMDGQDALCMTCFLNIFLKSPHWSKHEVVHALMCTMGLTCQTDMGSNVMDDIHGRANHVLWMMSMIDVDQDKCCIGGIEMLLAIMLVSCQDVL